LIFEADFSSGKLPVDWHVARDGFTIEDGALHNTGVTLLQIPLPDHGFHQLIVSVEIEPIDGGAIACGEPRATIQTDLAAGCHEVVTYGGAPLASAYARFPEPSDRHTIRFEFNRGQISATCDDLPLVDVKQPSLNAMAHKFSLQIWQTCRVHQIRVEGEQPLAEPRYSRPPRQDRPFELEVAVDFMDDMHYAPYTESMFEQLFDEYKRWGVRRVHWMYKGGIKHGMWEDAHVNIWENFQQTVQNIGGEVFPHAIKLARERGIEVYGLWKPFELAQMLCSVPHDCDAAKRIGKLKRVGGWIYWASQDVRQRRDLIMRRKPTASGPAENEVFHRIDLVKEDDRPAGFGVNGLRIYVSDDNHTYRPYEGPLSAEELIEDYPVWEHTPSGGRPTGQVRRARVMRLDNLKLISPFFVITTPSHSRSFCNTLINLIHVFGERGEERMLTFGLSQRVPQLQYDISSALSSRGDGQDFLAAGVEFDCLPSTPSACLPAYDAIRLRHALDGADRVFGVARGKDLDAAGCMSPAFDETRTYWLQWVREMLDYGVDGVDLRLRNHHSHLAWGEYGYEQPVRDAFLKRHGVDIWATDDFDRAALRRLRGEHYTTFYRDVRRLLNKHGKPLRLHVSPTMDLEPEFGGGMDMQFDWRTWLDEGLADSVTAKEVYPYTAQADELLQRAANGNIPVIFSPFANNIWRNGNGASTTADRIQQAIDAGYDGFQLYESCSVMRAHPDGRLEMERPALRDVFKHLI